jgi:predicted phage tail protein
LYLEASNPITVDLPVPAAPSQINVPTANDPGTGNFALSWTMPANPGTVTHYEVEESLISDFSTSKQVYSGTALNVNISYKIDAVYYYRVRACNTSLCSAYTAGANPVTVSGSPVLPAILSIITNLLLN